jgi:phosphatidylglycerol:prolipoprotein diacylglycerol transferase
VITAIAWFAKKQNKTLLGVGDFVAPLIPLGLFFGRIGNFINGELWGRASDAPWAMVFPTGGPIARHPSQLYEAVLEGLVLFAIIYLVNKKRRPEGVIGGLFLFGYGFFRFIVEYFREPDAHIGLYGDFISQGQILSLPMILAGLGLIIWAYKRQPKERNA